MMRIVLTAILFILASTAVAQQPDAAVVVDAPQPDDSARLEYVIPYKNHFFMWPVLKQRSLNFRVQYDKDEGNNLTYRPNKPFSLGFGVYMFDLGLEFTWALPINEHSEERFGNSWSRDLQINALSKNWGADLYYQKYEGFYINDSKVDIRRDEVHPQRADIVTRNFGISGVYVLNHEKYSFRTAFTFSEKQLKSKGLIFYFRAPSTHSGCRAIPQFSTMQTSRRLARERPSRCLSTPPLACRRATVIMWCSEVSLPMPHLLWVLRIIGSPTGKRMAQKKAM
ncbi:MAG: DUF4421 domain-containing protein [Bacteroidia bacterium]|nr:DUF4421 domain-containing protein [Bacteroidia bacterium]